MFFLNRAQILLNKDNQSRVNAIIFILQYQLCKMTDVHPEYALTIKMN